METFGWEDLRLALEEAAGIVKLRSGLLRAVARLGQCYEDGGRWEEAVSCYGKGIESDELAEELYRRLMACYIGRGRAGRWASRISRSRGKFSGAGKARDPCDPLVRDAGPRRR
jgi:hypothetical protein